MISFFESKPILALALVLILIGTAHVLALRSGQDWGDDFAMYILNARNLAEGRPYADTGYIYNPGYAYLGPPAYPPVLPMMLAPIYRWSGLNMTGMKLVMIGSLLAALAALYACVRRELPQSFALVLVAIVGLHSFLLREVNSIGSDWPFLAYLFLTLFCIQKAYADRQRPAAPSWGWLLASAVTMYLAFGTRTVGGVLVIVLLATDIVYGRRLSRQALVAAVMFSVLAITQSLLLHQEGGGYRDQLALAPLVLLHNAGMYVGRFVAFWHNGYSKALAAVLFVAMTALAGIGYVGACRRRITVLEIFPAAYMGVILLFPAYQGERFLIPVFPLYVYYALLGMRVPAIVQQPVLRVAVPAVLLGATCLSFLARYTTLDFGPIAEGPYRAESVALFRYLDDHTSSGDVIIFSKPRALSLYTARRAAVHHQAADDASLWDYFRKIGATYAVVFANDRPLMDEQEMRHEAYLRDFIERNHSRFDDVYSNADFKVCKFKPGTTPSPVVTGSPKGMTDGQPIEHATHHASTEGGYGPASAGPAENEEVTDKSQILEPSTH